MSTYQEDLGRARYLDSQVPDYCTQMKILFENYLLNHFPAALATIPRSR
jgi:hypothetical protein